jgi:phosphatidate cytidylyltransferase
MLFKYHSFYTFCLLASGMILFVLSLQEGHYAYQFKQLGWSMLNLTVIVTAGHGHLVGLWKLRLWFVYTISCMCLRDMVDNIVSNFLPIGLPLHSLSPKSSVLGYIIGGVCAFAYYFYAAQMMLNNYWFNVSPTKLGLTPFDYQSVHVDTSSNLFKIRPNHWEMGPIGELKFDASPIQIHLFVITCFVAIIAPFGALFFTALKRALKAEQLG